MLPCVDWLKIRLYRTLFQKACISLPACNAVTKIAQHTFELRAGAVFEVSPNGEMSWRKRTETTACCFKITVASSRGAGAYDRVNKHKYAHEEGFTIEWTSLKGNRFGWYLLKPGGKFAVAWTVSEDESCPPMIRWKHGGPVTLACTD